MLVTCRLTLLCLVLSTVGCSDSPKAAPKAVLRPQVRIVPVEKRTIIRMTSQPGFIEAYEQTSLFANVQGFVDEWKVDIGEQIRKDQMLAHLFAPDVVAQYEEKQAEIRLRDDEIKVAQQAVQVAEENWNAANAQVEEAKANLGKYEADVELRKVDYKRISELVASKSIEVALQDESYKRLETSEAAYRAGKVSVTIARVNRTARKADLDKARVVVIAARARAEVARAEGKRYAALVEFTSIKAPYDGVVIVRNVNTGDFVQPQGGDQSVPRSNQGMMSSTGAVPLYVVARTDKVRIFLDVPEMEAVGIGPGNPASVSIDAANNMQIATTVARTSWALQVKSRTLRAEVDILNPSGQILPGMYALGTVELKRAGVWTVPLEALVEIGNQTSCYEKRDGKAMLLPVQRGIDDGQWVEVLKKRVNGKWVHFDGSEQIILGDLSELSSGQRV
jgi:HlyD family secretion protein